MERGVERGLGRVLARHVSPPGSDLLERKRVVAEQRAVLSDEGERRLGRLVVAVDRRRLTSSHMGSVLELDLNDVFPVACLSRDHERLCEAKAANGGDYLHAGSLLRRRPWNEGRCAREGGR